jgi:hypothetical protein
VLAPAVVAKDNNKSGLFRLVVFSANSSDGAEVGYRPREQVSNNPETRANSARSQFVT